MPANTPTAYEELVEYLAAQVTPEVILAFEVSPGSRTRAEDLIARSASGDISPEEQTELEQLLHFYNLIAILKSRALNMLPFSE